MPFINYIPYQRYYVSKFVINKYSKDYRKIKDEPSDSGGGLISNQPAGAVAMYFPIEGLPRQRRY